MECYMIDNIYMVQEIVGNLLRLRSEYQSYTGTIGDYMVLEI